MSETMQLHATTICLNGRAVLLRGPSGSGKSDLALQLMETAGTGLAATALTATLVADDQTYLERRGDVVIASAPATIRGLFEIRGFGIITVPVIAEAPVALIVDLRPAKTIERLPQPEDQRAQLLGLSLPRLALDPTTPSAAARIRVALMQS